MYKPVAPILHSLLLIILIGTFYSAVHYINREPSVTPAPVLPPTPVPTPSRTLGIMPGAGWSLLQPGLERRRIEIYDGQNQHVESLYIWRLDQKFFRFDVAFDERGKSLQNWQEQTHASLVMNGGYFRVENERYLPNGLTIVNGRTLGSSYVGYGGMLAINGTGAQLRWLVERPYAPYENFQAALQSFPILVKPGGELGFGAEREDHKQARRTVIGQDKDGRILLIVAPQGYFTLHGLSTFLTDSDLNLDIAVNLDGGGSTGILAANSGEIIPSKTLLPFVILAYAR
jgi:hypothetical protein